MDQRLGAALRLHRYLTVHHWRERALTGPDPGIRFTYRIGRFIKSAAPGLPWRDDYYYLQAQGYWVLGNWRLYAALADGALRDSARNIAIDCSRQMLARQRDDGAWEYPHVEWSGRIATVEGVCASLGLLETYRRTADPAFLDGARRWHRFMLERIGFEPVGDGIAVNYFAGHGTTAVANNSACVLRFLAELADATGDASYLEPCAGLLRFLTAVQRPSGELPYAVNPSGGPRAREHFQCYQYNAFQTLDLLRYFELTGEGAALTLLRGLIRFVRSGLGADGHAFYACGNYHGAVTYHAAVLGAALISADPLGEVADVERGRRALRYVLGQQRADGSMPHSRRDYGLLRDTRPYPRYLAMMLLHLLTETDDSARPTAAEQRLVAP